ncbi:hypothetical protein LWI28_010313 [Acer negundo]|uniref:Uncharacterized protein n=1 Tax=Acer negundo TaxID=4023 RepID=A0AAD5NJ42_ACENE|nr:hypothetical protein LWI28_010313 [Acer negundo]
MRDKEGKPATEKKWLMLEKKSVDEEREVGEKLFHVGDDNTRLLFLIFHFNNIEKVAKYFFHYISKIVVNLS